MSWKRSLGIVYIVSIIFVVLGYFFCKRLESSPFFQVYQLLVCSTYMWVPGICAIIFMKKEKKKLQFFHFINKQGLDVLWIPPAVACVGIAISSIFGGFSLEEVKNVAAKYHLTFNIPALNILLFIAILYLVAVVAGMTLNYLFALGEELFWRGYLWEKIRSMGFEKASLLIGCVWGVWHIPVIVLLHYNYPDHPAIGSLLMIVFCIAASPLFLYVREKEGSVVGPTMLHGIWNAFLPMCVIFFPQGNILLIAPLGISGILSASIVSGVLLRKYRAKKRLAASLLSDLI